MGTLLHDIRYAIRQITRNPTFSTAIAMTLSIGIAANTTVFSFVNSVFIQPLPYPRSDDLVQLWSVSRTLHADGGMSAPDFLDCQQQNPSLERLAAYQFQRVNVGYGEGAQRVAAIRTTADFLPILGTAPIQGRTFTSEEQLGRGAPVALVTWAAWQRHWSGQSNLIGSTVLLDGQSHTVVGILPAGFEIRFPFCGQGHAALAEPEIYLPLPLNPLAASRGARSLLTLGRLKPGVGLERAQVDAGVIANRLDQEYPASNKGWEFMVLPLHELRGSAGLAAPLLLTPVMLVLLIACVNVTNMLLAKAAGRQQEIAIRLALGVSRWRLVRQLVIESLTLSLVGGSLGVLASIHACSLIQKVFENSLLLVLPNLRISGTVLTFTAAISMVTGVLVGVVPALQAVRTSIGELLQGGFTSSGTPKSRRMSQALVVAEVSLALVLLTATGLLLRSLIWTLKVDLGFRPETVLCVSVALPSVDYAQSEKQAAFFEQLNERVRSYPGVESASLASSLPTGSRGSVLVRIPGDVTTTDRDERLPAGFTAVSSDYFKTLGVSLLAGRDFTRADGSTAVGTAIINSAMARKYWPDANPVGGMIEIAGQQAVIIGVVSDMRRPHMAGVFEPQPEVFVPVRQGHASEANLVVKTPRAFQTSVVTAIRQEVRTLEPCAVVSDVQRLTDAVSRSTSLRQLVMVLMGLFAGSGLLLAAIGVYGLTSYTVSRRRKEIGIRMALGALPRQVVGMILLEGSRLLCLGLIAGVPLLLAVGKIMAAKLYRVPAFDTPVCLGVVMVLTFSTAIACYLPARHAAKGDPLTALRHE